MTTPDLRKLRLLLPRLASDAPGEILAIVAAIRRTLAKEGLDLHDLAEMIGAPTPDPEPVRMVLACFEWPELLKPFEVDFLENAAHLGVVGWAGLSEKQAAWLRHLYQRTMLAKGA
jgi:hypothetical protein